MQGICCEWIENKNENPETWEEVFVKESFQHQPYGVKSRDNFIVSYIGRSLIKIDIPIVPKIRVQKTK
jgi:hypothetical protein